MSASSAREPNVGRSPGPASPYRGRGRPNSPYRQPGALKPTPSVVELPAGHSARIEAQPTSVGFIGDAFSMDSLEFLKWAARTFRKDNVTLCVLLFLMGSQEPGGLACVTQNEIADGISDEEDEQPVDQSQVSRAIKKLKELGLVHMPKRGRYQLQPAATLRGGTVTVDQPVRQRPGARTDKVRVKVDQLSLLADILQDPEVPQEFKRLARPGSTLPRRSPDGGK